MNQIDGRRVALSVALLAAITLLATACTGGSTGASVATLSATATSVNSAADSPSASATGNGALAFARCMRAHGLPNFPDPTGGGVFDKSKLQQMGYSTSQLRAVQDGPCKTLLPTASPSPAQTISVQQQQDYLNAAACMRSHGITNFPDPIFSNGSVTFVAPPGLQTSSAEFTQAQDICKKLIPTGLPYSGSGR